MADVVEEKKPKVPESEPTEIQPETAEGYIQNERDALRPLGWMYKERKLGPLTIPWYASPKIQLLMVAFVCFLCPGMYNAISGLGAGGQVDAKPADNASVALNSTFAVFAFFAGTFTNRMGIKLTLSLGGVGYCIYTGALLCYSHTQNSGFLIFAGALLGACAGLLWTAQGAIMMSYPEEGSKGRYISWFWIIFNLGGVIGSLIPLGQNIRDAGNHTVTDGTYIGFIVLMFCGAILALFLCDANKVIRKDGSRVVLMLHPTWQSEIFGLWETLLFNPYIILLFPMFFSSNWFYTYQQNGLNAAHFDTRTRALNNTLYWLAQIVAAIIFGHAFDIKGVRRTVKAKVALAVLFILTMAIYGGGYAWQRQQVSRAVSSATVFQKVDWTDSGFVGPILLYFFYGFYDAAWQTTTYCIMGSLSNSGRKTANFAGFYKGIQSAGAAIIWRVDANGTAYMTEFAATWGLLAASLVVAAPVVFLKVQDHVPVEEDLRFSDETVGDVLPGGEKVVG